MSDLSVEQVRNIPLLRCFNEAELAELLKLGEYVSFPEYTNIVIEGEPSWGVYLLLEGEVEVSRAAPSGNAYHIATLKGETFFGELSLVDQEPRSATVRSSLPVKLFHIEKSKFHAFLNKDSNRKLRFMEHALGLIVSRLREVDGNFVVAQYQLWSHALKERVA